MMTDASIRLYSTGLSWAAHPNMFLLVELTLADRDVCTACGLTFSSTCCSSRGSSSIFLIRDYNA